ncbi:MAG: biopolymer transporter ExbD [Pseudomonadota bacterium]
MSFYSESRRGEDSEASILPLINVVFLLLIFFMVLGSLTATEPFKVSAPESTVEDSKPLETIRLLYGANGRLAIDGSVLAEAKLLGRVKAAMEQNPNTQVQLKADADLQGNQIVLLMEQLGEVGVERVYLMTLPKGS